MHDELFDYIESMGPGTAIWTDADIIVGSVSVFRDSGIMAHPGYLATMKEIGAKELWEERGTLEPQCLPDCFESIIEPDCVADDIG